MSDREAGHLGRVVQRQLAPQVATVADDGDRRGIELGGDLRRRLVPCDQHQDPVQPGCKCCCLRARMLRSGGKKKRGLHRCKPLDFLVVMGRIELPTYGL